MCHNVPQRVATSDCACVVCISRNIGKLSRTIKSRVHPEENLVNRYLLAAGVTQRDVFTELDADEIAEDESHPLVPLGAVNSTSNRTIQQPIWPKLTKSNSRFIEHTGRQRVAQRILQPYVGSIVVQRNFGRSHRYFARGTCNPVRIGPWKFTTESLMDIIRPRPGTNHSYFAIRARHVIHEAEWVTRMQAEAPERMWYGDMHRSQYDPDQLLIGQFHRFISLRTDGWMEGDNFHQIGECTIWRPIKDDDEGMQAQGLNNIGMNHQRAHPVTPDVLIIDLKRYLLYDLPEVYEGRHPHRGGKKIKYIPLQHVETQVALGPMIANRKVDRPRGAPVPLFPEHIFYAAMLLSV